MANREGKGSGQSEARAYGPMRSEPSVEANVCGVCEAEWARRVGGSFVATSFGPSGSPPRNDRRFL